MIQTYESNNRRHAQKKVKLGTRGQRGLDVFISTSSSTEMSNTQMESVETVPRTFQCIKCGAINEEVPCYHGIMKCVQCGNAKKNIENEMYFAEHDPDYLKNCLDTDDQAFNFKEMCKFNTLKHSERLGGMEVDPVRLKPYNFVPVTGKQFLKSMDLDTLTRYDFHKASGITVDDVVTYKTACNVCGETDRKTKCYGDRYHSFPFIREQEHNLKHDPELLEIKYQRGDGSEIAFNVLKRNAKLVNMLQTGDTKLLYKPVQINSWKKILRDNQDVLSALRYEFDPENPPLSPRELSNWTWNFRSLTTYEEKLKAFLRIIPQKVNKKFIQELTTGEETSLIIDFGDYNEVKVGERTIRVPVISGEKRVEITDLIKQDWINLRSRLAAEYSTNHPYDIFKRQVSNGRIYYNPMTPMFQEILQQESSIA